MFTLIQNGSQCEGMDSVGLMCWLLGSKMVALVVGHLSHFDVADVVTTKLSSHKWTGCISQVAKCGVLTHPTFVV